MKVARLVLALVIVADVAQCVSMVRRGSRGESDLSMFHQAAAAVRQGAGEELYRQPDGGSGWLYCIPPAGVLFFYPAASVGNTAWSLIWLAENLVFLAAAVWSLSTLLARTPHRPPALTLAAPVVATSLPAAAPADRPGQPSASPGRRRRPERILRGLPTSACETRSPGIERMSHQGRLQVRMWSITVLLALAAGSLQVGQLSILFVACWSVAALALQQGRGRLAHLALAIPAAIKLYPALMLAVPLTLASGRREAIRHLRHFTVAFLLVAVGIPAAVWGLARTSGLEVSFVENAILGQHGRLHTMIDLHSTANQGLDAVLLRYLTSDPVFHGLHAHVPHLNWSRSTVLILTAGLRGIVLLTALWFARRWLAPRAPNDRWATIYATGIWVATLYLIIPETRARYAVYASLAFVPLLHQLLSRWQELNRLPRVVAAWTTALTAVLVLSLVPHELRVYGVGLLGSIALWIASLIATRAHAGNLASQHLDRLLPSEQDGRTVDATCYTDHIAEGSSPRPSSVWGAIG